MEHTKIKEEIKEVTLCISNKYPPKKGDTITIMGKKFVCIGNDNPDTVLSNLTPEDLASTKE